MIPCCSWASQNRPIVGNLVSDLNVFGKGRSEQKTLTKQWPGKWRRQGAFVCVGGWGDKAGEDAEGSSRGGRRVQYFWVNVMADGLLECANGGCSLANNSESIPWLPNESEFADISNLFGPLPLEGIDYNQSLTLDITQTIALIWRYVLYNWEYRFSRSTFIVVMKVTWTHLCQ